jgi:hypothetical protein
MTIRAAALQRGRADRLTSCLASEDADGFLLVRTLRAIHGRAFANIVDPRPRLQFYAEEHLAPLDRSLSALPNGPTSVKLTSWLIRLPINFNLIHSLFLWLMDHWRSYSGQSCHRCGTPAPRQEHILDCGGLSEALLTLPVAAWIPLSIVGPSCIFHLISQIMDWPVPRPDQVAQVTLLARTLRSAVAAVTGCNLR